MLDVLLDVLLLVLPFLSFISVAVTVVAWVRKRRDGLLLVDAGVMVYFSVITPDVAGFFWVLLIVVLSSVYNIAVTIINIFEEAPDDPPKTFGLTSALLMVVQGAVLTVVILSVTLFGVADEAFLYNAITPPEVLEGYLDWFYTRTNNIAVGMTVIYGFNLLLILILRISKGFTKIFVVQSILSFAAVILVFFIETDDGAWALERVREDLAALESGEIQPRVLVFGMSWNNEGDFRLHPGEFTALHFWGVRDLDVEGQHLLFARSMPHPEDIRQMMQGEEYQLHQIDPEIRFILVTHTPRLGVVLEIIPINDPEIINQTLQGGG
ncbi:MAG: hypothetical protein FWB98_00295 [Defluviitaleaceae bacterium]|nr:hypothetical protein [Defluviitaleaceae bacterium]